MNGPQRHNFPAVVLVPQLEFHDARDGVNHEWAAFTGIDGGTGNCSSAPDYSEGGAFARGVVADLVAGDLVVDGAVVNVDADRLILTGHSMGGLGTWDFIGREPSLWAAAVPMAGFPDFARADALVDTRIWAFHHRIDCFNTFNGTNTMHERIVAAGGTKMEFTALEFDTGGACDQAHFQTPDRAFGDEALLPWMFSQVRGR